MEIKKNKWVKFYRNVSFFILGDINLQCFFLAGWGKFPIFPDKASQGGTLVFAHVRGGREKGKEWHK